MSTGRKRKGRPEPAPNGVALSLVAEPTDKAPPHDLVVEQELLAAMLFHPEVVPEVLGLVDTDDLFREAHGLVFASIKALHLAGAPIDLAAVHHDLQRRRKLSDVGGAVGLAELAKPMALAANACYHALIVRELARKRALIPVADDILRAAYDPLASFDDIAAPATARISGLMAQTTGRDGVTECVADIEEEEVEWLWPNRIVLGNITTFAGPTGLGKTFVSMYVIATVTRGGSFHDQPDRKVPAGSALYITAEDSIKTTIRPRLRHAGADLSKVRVLKTATLGSFTLADIPVLERAIAEMGDVRLIVIDPPQAHTGDHDENNNSEVRALLTPLRLFAEKHRIAILLVTHTSKGGNRSAAARVIGSVAWLNSARVASMFFRDPDNKARRLMVSLKNNLGEDPSGLAYAIVKPGNVEWKEGDVEADADDLIEAEASQNRQRGKAPTKSENDAEWLWNQLADGPQAVAALVDVARNDSILSKKEGAGLTPLYNAKKRLPKLHPGYAVDEFEVEVGNRARKHWQILPSPNDANDPDRMF